MIINLKIKKMPFFHLLGKDKTTDFLIYNIS
jgi:hypothetical protein